MDKKDELPTMPSSEPPPPSSNSATVWLVSYADDDDRELRPPQIAEALNRGEIHGQTIVWTDGMPEWLPIERVPSLAKLLPSSGDTAGAPEVAATGGFLGTGMGVNAGTAAEPTRRSSKPPLPRRVSEPPPPSDDEEPVSVVPESVSPESAAAFARPPSEPAAPPAPAPAFSIGDTEPTQGQDDEEIEEAPSSGTPSLGALASLPPQAKRRIDDELLALGGSDVGPSAPPTIDISNIASDAPPPTDDKAKKEDRNTTPPVSEGSAPFIPDTRTRKADEQKSTSIVPWIVALGASGIAAWALLQRGAPPPAPPELPKVEAPAQQPAARIQPEADPTPAPSTEPEPAASAEPPASASAGVPAAPGAGETPKEPSAPAVSPSPTAPTSPTTAAAAPTATGATATATSTASAAVTAAPPATSATAEKPAEESTAPPFDKAAAAASLGAQAAVASSCRKEGDPTGTALVTVTFASSGRAVRATVDGPPFAGTRTGGCIASTMRQARVPAFSGDRITVQKTVRIR